MAITTSMPTSFKKELFEARHNFLLSGGNTFKLALFSSSATLGAATTAYPAESPAYEPIDANSPQGYPAGGLALTRIDPANSGTSGICDFADLVIPACTVTARGCMIYNSSYSNAAVYIGNFGSDKTSTAGTFTVTMPTPAAGTAILELA